ncbi:ammonium transporter [Guillardia theta CCMP2712]|uniref:Ammonium transporter n=1 Tax=Guillardia theta (strain CCMP2712) TaxID=905079 RepID=L1JEX0_GUITC|nr:ammonium transporter [Guillardia theta CCMP2712]EKX47046.1 ammonium transporter [Guillardia theta CCMP2712]|eukprot:XP_005834026.1 ammonium transporter [Guillardia theta CCMP2712]
MFVLSSPEAPLHAGASIFCMNIGLVLIEASSLKSSRYERVALRTITSISLAALSCWILGFGFGFGIDRGGFIGSSKFALDGLGGDPSQGTSDEWERWFLFFSVSSICGNISTLGLSERGKIEAISTYMTVLVSVVYPIIVHWCWGTGWLSAWGAYPDADGSARPIFHRSSDSNGLLDVGGAGVVYLVGGCACMVATIFLGGSDLRFVDRTMLYQEDPVKSIAHLLGVLTFWFGSFSFNSGFQPHDSPSFLLNAAAKGMVTTAIAGGAGCLTSIATCSLLKQGNVAYRGLNGTMVALVAISSCAIIVDPWMSLIVGTSSSLLALVTHLLINRLSLCDPCDVIATFAVGGGWGLLCAGIFCTDADVQAAQFPNKNRACASGEQFGVQLVGLLVILTWTSALSWGCCFLVDWMVGMHDEEQLQQLVRFFEDHRHSMTTAHISSEVDVSSEIRKFLQTRGSMVKQGAGEKQETDNGLRLSSDLVYAKFVGNDLSRPTSVQFDRQGSAQKSETGEGARAVDARAVDAELQRGGEEGGEVSKGPAPLPPLPVVSQESRKSLLDEIIQRTNSSSFESYNGPIHNARFFQSPDSKAVSVEHSYMTGEEAGERTQQREQAESEEREEMAE